MEMFERFLKTREKNEREQEKREVFEAQLEEATQQMEMKLCPTNNLRPCFRQCAHFEEGSVRDLGIEYPSCKLWKY